MNFVITLLSYVIKLSFQTLGTWGSVRMNDCPEITRLKVHSYQWKPRAVWTVGQHQAWIEVSVDNPQACVPVSPSYVCSQDLPCYLPLSSVKERFHLCWCFRRWEHALPFANVSTHLGIILPYFFCKLTFLWVPVVLVLEKENKLPSVSQYWSHSEPSLCVSGTLLTEGNKVIESNLYTTSPGKKGEVLKCTSVSDSSWHQVGVVTPVRPALSLWELTTFVSVCCWMQPGLSFSLN